MSKKMPGQMSVKKDLKCSFNMPEKLESQFNGDEETYHGLPPYAPCNTYPVDKYEACPNNWMHGSDIASSYFVGVKENHGMWLDFNECFYHTHDVAIVISIQGINPITGQKMIAEQALRLEQYHKKCPIHGVDFQQDRFCKECGFNWPGQNYLATTGTPEMMLWLDGFRTLEGKVRQYLFTEDKMRGVASQLIGEDRVFAIGIAYYLSKNKKPYTLMRPEERKKQKEKEYEEQRKRDLDHRKDMFKMHSSSCVSSNSSSQKCTKAMFFSPIHTPQNWETGLNPNAQPMSNCLGFDDEILTSGLVDYENIAQSMVEPIRKSVSYITPVKKLEIGAGALIKQRIYDDPKMMSYWEEKPAGMIYVNYCDEETKKKILDRGRRAGKKDGFLQNIKVGG